MNLVVNPDDTSDASTSITVENAKPGDNGYVALGLERSGSVSGAFKSINIGAVDESGSYTEGFVTDTDGTASEFETSDPSTGQLDESMKIEVFFEPADSTNASIGTTPDANVSPLGGEDTTTVVDSGTLLSTARKKNSVPGTVTGTPKKVLVFNWWLPEEETGNEIQGDELVFDIQIEFEQS